MKPTDSCQLHLPRADALHLPNWQDKPSCGADSAKVTSILSKVNCAECSKLMAWKDEA